MNRVKPLAWVKPFPRDERAAMIPGGISWAGISWAGVTGTLRLKVCRDPDVRGISHPLLAVSTTSNYLEMGPNVSKSPMGMNILTLTRCPAQVTATLTGRRANTAQHSSPACSFVDNLQAKMMPTNTNKNVKIHCCTWFFITLWNTRLSFALTWVGRQYSYYLCIEMGMKAAQHPKQPS